MRFQPALDKIPVYEAGKPIELVVREYGISPDKVIKLASNENPYGVSPKVENAIREAVYKMPLYPDDSYRNLKDALASAHKVDAKNVIQGNGSDQIFDFATRSVLDPGDKILQNGKTFSMYSIYAGQCGAETISVDSVIHDLDLFLDSYKKNSPKIIFICTPCNPIGDALNKDDLFSFLEKISPETMVVVDAAYMEFGKTRDPRKEVQASELISKFPNALYTNTFSKIYGLGGMRIGYGIGNEELIQAFYKLRPPFNVSQLSQLAATIALEDRAFVEEYLKANLKELLRYEAFAKTKGLPYFESYTNFITIELDKARLTSTSLFETLLKEGIILRNLKSYGLNAIRITIGRPEQNDIVLDRLEKLL
ncbi:histidinol-phosphate transaminase [Leptospira langatensis]|uniref:Histidinol-phosphate aminotransferase n=1 Tax=Leptospira langatensis TaxID=2484983 RepID=A0A5F1ZW57_9LEPT|nr:histidinol-phosphate transaminase [Leptospira langatensis]TGK00012.1 histidinol-phosphate transaminase [Leptospira langatensis]TGL42647.1 histidinol-phosphate transaminase [Leptospira langatensis]